MSNLSWKTWLGFGLWLGAGLDFGLGTGLGTGLGFLMLVGFQSGDRRVGSIYSSPWWKSCSTEASSSSSEDWSSISGGGEAVLTCITCLVNSFRILLCKTQNWMKCVRSKSGLARTGYWSNLCLSLQMAHFISSVKRVGLEVTARTPDLYIETRNRSSSFKSSGTWSEVKEPWILTV